MNIAALQTETQALIDQAVLDVLAEHDPAQPDVYSWLFGVVRCYLPDAVNDAATALVARRTEYVRAGVQ